MKNDDIFVIYQQTTCLVRLYDLKMHVFVIVQFYSDSFNSFMYALKLLLLAILTAFALADHDGPLNVDTDGESSQASIRFSTESMDTTETTVGNLTANTTLIKQTTTVLSGNANLEVSSSTPTINESTSTNSRTDYALVSFQTMQRLGGPIGHSTVGSRAILWPLLFLLFIILLVGGAILYFVFSQHKKPQNAGQQPKDIRPRVNLQKGFPKHGASHIDTATMPKSKVIAIRTKTF